MLLRDELPVVKYHVVMRWVNRLPRLFCVAALGLVLTSSGTAMASPFGINAHIPSDTVLDALAQSGIGWVRIDFLWPVVQPTQGDWDWTTYDHVVEAARQRGLEIYATLAYSPEWATAGTPGPGVPRNSGDWARFCYRAARRYRGLVAAWGMWNEPNLTGFWEGSRHDYIELILLPGARAIHAADPRALVSAPDTAHLHSAHWDGWLSDVIGAASGELDVVTHHVYPPGSSHEPVTSYLERDASNPWDDPSVKKILQQAGWFGRPFWLTETGIPSNVYGTNDQASFYHQLLLDWFRPGTDLNWMDRIFFYEAADDPRVDAYGILGPAPDYAPKTAYFTYSWFISDAEVDDARILSAEVPAFLKPGAPTAATVVVENSGTTTWTAEDGYRLSVLSNQSQLTVDGLALPSGLAVPPGGTVEFGLTLTGSEGPLAVDLLLRMEHAGARLFGPALRQPVTIHPLDPPTILSQPQGLQTVVGAVVSFEVKADGPAPLSYRWQLDGVDVEDGTHFIGSATDRLTVVVVTANETGTYRCIVTNEAGAVASAEADLGFAAGASPRRGAGRAKPLPGREKDRDLDPGR